MAYVCLGCFVAFIERRWATGTCCSCISLFLPSPRFNPIFDRECPALSDHHTTKPLSLASPFSYLPLPLLLHRFIMRLLPTRLRNLYPLIVSLKPARLILPSQNLFHERLLPIPVVYPGAKILRPALDDRSHLRVLGCFRFAAFFLVVSMRIEDTAHLKELEVPF